MLLGVAFAASLLVAIVMVRNGAPSAVALVVLPFAGLWAVSRPGLGLCLAIGTVLAIPQTYPHVWLIAPIAAAGGLIAGRAAPKLRYVDLAVGALALWVALSWILHPEYHIALQTFVQVLVPLALYFAPRLTVTPSLVRPTLWAIMLAGSAGAVSVLYDWVTRTVHFADPTAYQWVGGEGELFRPGGIYGGSPAAAVCLALALVATIPLQRGRHRPVALGGSALMLWAIALTLARAGWIGLIVGFAVACLLIPIRAPRIGVALAGAVAAILVFTLYSSFSDTSPAGTLGQSTFYRQGVIRPGSATGRTQFLSLALPLVGDSTKHLLVGRGFEAFKSRDGTYDAHTAERPELLTRGGPHNEFLRAWLEQGLIGLALLLSWMIGGVVLGVGAARRLAKRSEDRLVAASLTGAFVVYLVACLFHDWMHNPVTLAVAALISGLLVTVADHSHRGPAV